MNLCVDTEFSLLEQSKEGILPSSYPKDNNRLSVVDAWILLACAPAIVSLLMYGWLYLTIKETPRYQSFLDYIFYEVPDSIDSRFDDDDENSFMQNASDEMPISII